MEDQQKRSISTALRQSGDILPRAILQVVMRLEDELHSESSDVNKIKSDYSCLKTLIDQISELRKLDSNHAFSPELYAIMNAARKRISTADTRHETARAEKPTKEQKDITTNKRRGHLLMLHNEFVARVNQMPDSVEKRRLKKKISDDEERLRKLGVMK